jgi:hypothetical protein
MKPELPLTLEEIAALPTPADALVTNPQYLKRKDAMTQVLTGTPLVRAAALTGVNRNTLGTVLRNAFALHVDGKVNGFRACEPFFRCVDFAPAKAPVTLPSEGRAHAFGKIVAGVEAVGALINGFKGKLPDNDEKSPAFDTLFKKFKTALRKAGLEGKYPLKNDDEGRRALLHFVRRARLALKELGLQAAALMDPCITRIPSLFAVNPFDCVQFDAHFTDVDWTALVPAPDGGAVPRELSGIWLLSAFDVASLAVIAWLLIVGRNYNEYDVQRLLVKCLTPWRRRKLMIPGLHYRPDAWMPTAVEHGGEIPRAIEISGDNHKAHLSQCIRLALADHAMGVYALGPPYVPEIRSEIESFHKSFENHFIRYFAGAYKPAKELGEAAKKTTRLSPDDYPLESEALDEVTDVYMANYNATANDARQQRSPREICEAFRAGGGWLFTSSLTPQHLAELSTVRRRVTIRGCKGTRSRQKQPHVNYEGAYRSSALHGRFDLVGQKFWAEHPLDDARKITLRTVDTGNVYVVLDVEGPWKYTACSIETRKKIKGLIRKGCIVPRDHEDIVTAYHIYIRANAHRFQRLADEFVKLPKDVRSPTWSPPVHAQPVDQPVFMPRGGPIRLGRRTRS